MKHVGTIAGRELRSLFISPVAYIVMAIFALLSALFFLLNAAQFQLQQLALAEAQRMDQLMLMNLNEDLIYPFLYSMWLVLLFLVPAITMGLFASDKSNSTEELLLTSPITIWDIVLGKYLAAATFVFLLVLILGAFPGILFLLGSEEGKSLPEAGQTLSGLLGTFLIGLTYAATGTFASSTTRHQIIAFFMTLALLFVFLLFGIFSEMASANGAFGKMTWVSATLAYISSVGHLDQMLRGLVDTLDLAYFIIMIAVFLVLTKTSVEVVRWK